MSSGETETVSLNLDGNFAAQAEKDAQAASKLETALDKLGKAREKQSKSTPMVDALAGSATYSKLSNAVGKIFGQGAASKLDGAAAKLAEAGDKLGVSPEMLKAAGGAVATGGTMVAAGAAAVTAAAAALTIAAGAVLYAGIKFGVEQTDAADVQKKIFAKVGKGDGYKVAVKVAADLGLDENVAQSKVKALLNAKFKSSQVETIIKVGIGLDQVAGDGAGDKFVKTLETIKNAGKFDAKSVKQFAKEGISAEEVYAKLAKSLGISVDAAKAKVKAGTLDIDTGIKGVIDVASTKFGGIGDALATSIPGLFARIKLKFGDLFKGFNIEPIKGFLKNVIGVLDSGEGRAFGKAFGKLGSTIVELLFGPLSGSSGKDKMTAVVVAITSGVKKITAYLNEAKPTIKAATAAILDILSPKKGSDGPGAKIRQMAADFAGLYKSVAPVAGPLWAFAKVPLGVALFAFTTATKIFSAALGFFFKPLSQAWSALQQFAGFLNGTAPKAAKSGAAIGKAIPAGIIAGIQSGVGAALAAAGNLASAMFARVKSILGIASPSKAFAFVGAMNAQGMAKGMNDNATAPANAAAKMAAGTAAAAGGKGGGGKGAGAGGGGAAPVFNITVNPAPGTTPAQARALGQAAGEGAYEAWVKNKRTYDRAQQEGRAA